MPRLNMGGTFTFTVRELLEAALAYMGNHETAELNENGQPEPRRIQAALAIDEESGVVMSVVARGTSDETAALTIAVREGYNPQNAKWCFTYVENTMDGDSPRIVTGNCLDTLFTAGGGSLHWVGRPQSLVHMARCYREYVYARVDGTTGLEPGHVWPDAHMVANLPLEQVPGYGYYGEYPDIMAGWLAKEIMA